MDASYAPHVVKYALDSLAPPSTLGYAMAPGAQGRGRHAAHDFSPRYDPSKDFVDPRVLAAKEEDVPPSRCCTYGCSMSHITCIFNSARFMCNVPYMCSQEGRLGADLALRANKLVCLGMPTWSALQVSGIGLQGMGRPVSGMPLDLQDDFWHIPTDELPMLVKQKNEAFSKILGADFWTGVGDYDYPTFTINPGQTAVILLLNKTSYHRRTKTKFTVEGWRAMLVHVLGRSDFGYIIDTQANLHNPNSLEGFLRFFTAGGGANLLEACSTGFKVDMTYMEGLPVRDGYKRYGGIVYLDPELCRIDSVVYEGKTYTPDDREFIGACHAVRASQFVMQAIGVHATQVHTCTVNWTSIALRLKLPGAHPVRRLLSPFTIWGPTISNFANDIILANGGVVTRVTAFDHSEHATLLKCAFKETVCWELFPEELKRKGLADIVDKEGEKFVYGYEGLQWWNLARSFVSSYLDLYYADDGAVEADAALGEFFGELAELWKPAAESRKSVPDSVTTKAALADFATQVIWTVTGLHEQIHAAEYVMEGNTIQSYIADGDLADLASLMPSMEDALMFLYVTMLVDMPSPPLCQDFSRFFLDDEAKRLQAEFMVGMNRFHEDMVQRNRNRTVPHWIFDPWCMCIAVTV